VGQNLSPLPNASRNGIRGRIGGIGSMKNKILVLDDYKKTLKGFVRQREEGKVPTAFCS